MAAVKLLVASESFWTEVDGEDKFFQRGVTKIRADHPLAKRAARYFEPADDVDRRDEVR